MSYFALLWKARTIEKYRQNYENEKINSIIMSNADIPDKTLFQRWRHYSHGMQKRLSRKFSKWYPAGSTVSNFFVSLRTDMKLPSILLRSLYGFVGGLLLTYLGFMFFVFQLSLSLMHATVLSSVMGVLLTLGLTFSNRMRCLIFLLIPQLFSRVGRYTLTCYALVLILTGPATNTLKNSEVLSESMACSQEQIKLNVRQINDSFKKPFNSIKDSLKITIQSMKLAVRNLKIALIQINRLILSIASVIQSSFSWLGSVVNKCNAALGTPMEKCIRALKENSQKYNRHAHKLNKKSKSHKDTLKKLIDLIAFKGLKTSKGREKINNRNIPLKNEGIHGDKDIKRSDQKGPWSCDKDNIAQIACSSMKRFGKFCVAADFTEETILATIRKKLKTFTYNISTLLHLKLNIQHTYTYIGNSSSTNQIAAGIITEIRNRADPIITWLSWSSCVTSLFLLLIIFRAKHYQHMFETRSAFDNRFITREFRELDLKRLREGRETVLPLNRRERAKYVTTTSFRLVASEKVHLNRSAMFMAVTTFKLMIHIVADYSLYWVLMTIRHHGKQQSPLKPGIADTGAFISGSGFVSRLLQSFIDALHLQLIVPPSGDSCLPKPYPPDFKRYCQIGFLIFLLWFFALLEPYGLRFRHLIMGHYRPERAKTRALWLYNHILRTRASFMKFARRKLHREYKYSSQSTMTFRHWMHTHIPYRWLKPLFGIKPKPSHCRLCNIGEEPDNPKLIKCTVPSCPGAYCLSCFSDIGQLCTICLSPSDYGDLSDVSLEKGSSDEDDSGDDCKPQDNNASNTIRRNLKKYANNSEKDVEDGNSHGRTHVRSNTFLLTRERSDIGKGSETYYPYLQHSCLPFIINYHNWTLNEFIATKIVNDTYEIILIEKARTHHIIERYDNGKGVPFCKGLKNNISLRPMIKMGLFQYSVYEIKLNPLVFKRLENTTKIAKYLRMKKIVKRKREMRKINANYFKTCSNTNINTLKGDTKQDDGKGLQAKNLRETNNEPKNNLPIRQLQQNHNKTKMTENDNNPNNKASKNKNETTGVFNIHRKVITYWHSVKIKMLPCNSLMNTVKDSPPINAKKHRRKKKHNTTNKHHATKNANLKKSYPRLGNSRLFAYLNERDWIENSFESTNKNNRFFKEEKSNDIGTNMLVNNILIPRLNLNITSSSTVETQINNASLCDATFGSNILSPIRKEFAKGALHRFFKSDVSQSSNIIKCSTFRHEDRELINEEHNLSSMHNNKYITYPNLEWKGNEDGEQLQKKCKEFRLKRIFSGSFSGYKLSKPFSLIKTVYSSIFLHGEESFDKVEKLRTTDVKLTHTKVDKKIKFKDTQTTKMKIENVKTKKEEVNNSKAQRTDEYQTKVKNVKQFNIINDDKEIQTCISLIDTANKGIGVYPLMNSFGSQKNDYKKDTQDCGIQLVMERRPMSQGHYAEVMTGFPTCTCAAQCRKSIKNACVFTDGPKNKPGPPEHSFGICDHIDSCDTIKSAVNKEFEFRATGRSGWQIHKSETSKKEELRCSSYSSSEPISFSDDSKTDTTVCSLANIDYHNKIDNVNKRDKRWRVKVVTKSNQSTATDKTKQCDVSTTTYDWWSPIIEKKDVTKQYKVEKKKGHNDIFKERNRRFFRSRGVNAAEKIVTFRSSAQLIPNTEAEYLDIMSPSRYLLESQKYYNELFCDKYKFPRVYPVTSVQQRNSTSEKDQSRIYSRHHTRRVRKTKRLEECYSPKKQLTSRRRGAEFVRSPEPSLRSRKRRTRN